MIYDKIIPKELRLLGVCDVYLLFSAKQNKFSRSKYDMMKKWTFLILLAVLLLILPTSSTFAQTTTLSNSFTYQGYLTGATGPVNLACDFQFGLFNASSLGTQVGTTVPKTNVAVNNGVFNVVLDFGAGAFNGQDRYLDIQVRCPTGGGAFTPLTPRQAITPSPYTMSAPWAGLSGVPAGFADGVDGDALGSLVCTNGQIPQWNGTAWVCAADNAGADWALAGNAGTTPATNFVGTTDDQPLEFRVNNLRAFRIEPNATSPNLIGGFNGNAVTAGVLGAVISGGGSLAALPNIVTDDYGFVGGGSNNQAGDAAGSTIDRRWAAVAGGLDNIASGEAATVIGGAANEATAQFSTITGGANNLASGELATTVGGFENTASGENATAVGGALNSASGNFSFAIGRRAQAAHEGAFVWGDSTDANFSSTLANQFYVRATGGVAFYTNAGLTTGCTLTTLDGSWACTSDRNSKEDFAAVDTQAVLNSVLNIPITSWSYMGAETRHIGPMAQDFYAAFGLGADNRHISMVDADGVALAAIQGLHQIVQDKDTRIAEMQTQLDDLNERLLALEALAAPSQAGLGNPLVILIAGASLGLFGWRLTRKGVRNES
jgi:hypothetical protein